MKINKKVAFSLIELLIVIAIVGILAAIAAPVYKNYKYKAQIAKAITVLDNLSNDVIQQYATGKWNCSTSTTFNYGGTSLPVNTDVFEFGDAVASLSVNSSYGGGFLCGEKYIGVTQINVGGLDGLTATVLGNEVVWVADEEFVDGRLGEMLCLLINNNGTMEKVCGIYSVDYEWQVPPVLLPAGYDCIISENMTTRGDQCSALLP